MKICNHVNTPNCVAEAVSYPPSRDRLGDVLNVLEACQLIDELQEDESCPYADWLREASEVDRDELRKEREKRSAKYGIEIRKDGHLTKPSKYSDLSDEEFGDPVNYRYPIDKEHIRAAISYFPQKGNYDKYTQVKSRRVIWNRIIAAAKKFGIEHKFNPDSPVDRLLNPELKRWAKANAGMGVESVETALAAIEEANSIPELLALESDIAVSRSVDADPSRWDEALARSHCKLKALAEKQGLEEIADSYTSKPEIIESKDGRLLVTGTFARVGIPTANRRVYPQSVWDANEEHISDMLVNGKLVGQDNHPVDGHTRLSDLNIVFKDIWQEGDEMRYEAVIPNTPAGEILKELIDIGVGVELSTRGYGSVKKADWNGLEDCYVVQDDYVLVAIDPLMEGAAVGTYMVPHDYAVSGVDYETSKAAESVEHDKSAVESPFEQTTDKEENTQMRKRVIAMLENSIKLAEAIGNEEVVATAKAALEALRAVESDEGEEFESALNAALEAIDAVAAACDEGSKNEQKEEKEISKETPQPTNEGVDLSEATKLLDHIKEVEKKIAEREARREMIEARDAKVEELMAGAEGLSEAYAAKLRSALMEEETADEVVKTYKRLYPVMQEASKAVEAGNVGIHIRSRDRTASITGELRERPNTVNEAVEQLVEGLVNSGVPDTGAHDPSNKVWVFRRIIENYASEHPFYLESLTRDGYARWRALSETTTSSDIAVGAPYILPLFREVFPKLVALELCSVQPIDRPDAKVFYKDAKTDPGDLALDTEANFDSTYADHTEGGASAKIKMVISSASVSATSKSLEATWTTELMQDLQAYHGMDAEAELLRDAADEIAREINYTLLEDMRVNCTGSTSRTFGTIPPTGSNYTGREWDQRLADFISRAAGDIADKTYRRPNWIVTDPVTASRFSALNTFVAAAPDEQNEFTLDVVYEGVLSNRWRVYSVGWFTDNTIMIGYKGADWNDAAYIYAPYIPVYISPGSYNTSTLVASRAVLTRFAKYFVNTNMVGRLTISATEGTDLT